MNTGFGHGFDSRQVHLTKYERWEFIMFKVGTTYEFTGDVVSPSFVVGECRDKSEYADNGFQMKRDGNTLSYRKNIIAPAVNSMCKCISTEPLIFEVKDINSPLLEDKVKPAQCEVVRKVLMFSECGTSDIEVQVIADVSIPWADRDKVPTEDIVLNTLIEYLKDNVGKKYTGSTNGALLHYRQLELVLTVILGRPLAYAVMKLRDTPDISVRYNDGKFNAYYKDEPLMEFLTSIRMEINGTPEPMKSFISASLKMG